MYFVIDVAGHIPGIPGIFLASLVSSSLSTMSASMNCLSGVIYDDFVSQWLPKSKKDEIRAAAIMKVKYHYTHNQAFLKFEESIYSFFPSLL